VVGMSAPDRLARTIELAETAISDAVWEALAAVMPSTEEIVYE
jgi:hypothetical protein